MSSPALPRVLSLADARLEDEAILGGKAVHLGAALRAGLPVPDGVVLPAPLVDAIAADRHGVLAELRARLDSLVDLDAGVAVRSSAIGEDGVRASFAGQHLTVLAVDSIDAAVDAIRQVHASARAPSAIAYRERMGVASSGGEPQMAVVIQRMVEPECAGVLFTRDPASGADQRVIECAWGLGEVVVAGLVVPDRYRLDRSGKILEQTAGMKDVMLRARSHAAGGGTEELGVDPSRARTPCLDASRLARLQALTVLCEAAFPGAHDLEFAFTPPPEDRLFLLQRRAITRTFERGSA